EGIRGRLADAVGTAFREGDGDCKIICVNAQPASDNVRLSFTERFECPNDGTRAPTPTPQLFSFNSPRGACPRCNGFGATLEDKKYKQYIRVFLRQYQTAQECPECHGTKLQPDALNVRVDDRDIASASELAVGDLVTWLDNVTLSDFERHVAAHLLKEARDR